MKAGFARNDITPDLGVRLGGYGIEERPAEHIFDSLNATALAIGQNGQKGIIISLDWICVQQWMTDKIREDISRKTGIAPALITVCATHTHSAPNTLNFTGWGDCENAYVESVIPKIVETGISAWGKMVPVELGFAQVQSKAGVNRRLTGENNEPLFLANENGEYDPNMTAVVFRGSKNKKISGVIVHYGAHGTAMGANRMISRDWPGVMMDRIESHVRAPVLFLNGAIGNVGPRTSMVYEGRFTSAGVGDGPDAVREVGYQAAADAVRAIISIREWRDDLLLSFLSETIILPYTPLKSLTDAKRDLKVAEAEKDIWGRPMCRYHYNRQVIEVHALPMETGKEYSQTITAIGPLAVIPFPGEIFSSISLRLRNYSPFQYTLCCSVANDSLGYFVDLEARMRGGYEPWIGRAVGPYLFADNIDDVLVNENLKLLRKIDK